MRRVNNDNDEQTDVVYGAKAIAKVIQEPNIRVVYYMLSEKQVPGASQPEGGKK